MEASVENHKNSLEGEAIPPRGAVKRYRITDKDDEEKLRFTMEDDEE
jgi:hypothetical protein